MPRIDSLIIEVPDPTGPHGAKGIAEPATIATAPAILNAIADAISKHLNRTPASPEGILGLLGQIDFVDHEIDWDEIPYPEV